MVGKLLPARAAVLLLSLIHISPKQLGVILFEKLGLPGGKKTKTGYSTAADVLDKDVYKRQPYYRAW